MADAFVEQVSGRIRVLMTRADGVIVPEYGDASRSGVFIASLMSRNPAKFVPAFIALGRLLRGASTFSITGADIMDGGYNPLASLLRWRMARAAQRAGIPTRVLGFSWNGRAPREVVRAAARAATSGVDLYVRDPVSRARMAKASIAPTLAASDTVFSLTQRDDSSEIYASIRAAKDEGHRVALVNASALVSKRIDQPAEYRAVLEALRRAGYLPVLLPHVNRGADGDSRAVELVSEAAPGLPWKVIDHLLRPAQILSILELSDLVVTGRMHLGIMALSTGTPAFVISTQGKVEGLAQLLDEPALLVSAEVGLGDRLAQAIEDDELVDAMRVRIRRHLAKIRSLSRANFAGISDDSPDRVGVLPGAITADATVSVVIPTHLRPDYLRLAVGSALRQSRSPLEVIVCSDVDDAEAETVVNELAEDAVIPVRYVYDPATSGGASASRNIGAGAASGSVLAFLDDDDLWEPEHLEAAIAAGARSGAHMAVTGRWMVKGSTRVEAPLLRAGRSAGDVVAVSLGTTGSNMVVSRAAFVSSGGFDEAMPVKNDTDFFFRFLLAGHRYEVEPKRLVLQVKHGTGQLTGNTERRAAGTRGYMEKHAVHLRERDRRHLRLSYYRIKYHLAENPATRYVYLVAALLNYSPQKYLAERATRRAWLQLEREES